MNVLASLVSTITDLHDLTSTTKHGSQDRQSGLTRILSGEKVSHGFDEILTRSYQGFDHSLFYQFALMDMTGTQLPRIARGYLDMERAFPNDSVKAMVLLHKGLKHAGNPAQEVIDNVAEFLRDSKLGGDDIAWKLISEIATYHSARVGEVPAERGNQDNFVTLDRVQKFSKKRPISALLFWFGVSCLIVDGFDYGFIQYNLMMRYGFYVEPMWRDDIPHNYFSTLLGGIIIISFIFSIFMFFKGTIQRKLIDLRHDKKLSFTATLVFILISHLVIILNIPGIQQNQTFDELVVLLPGLSVITVICYMCANSKWAHSFGGHYVSYPRLIFAMVLFIYLLGLLFVLTVIDMEFSNRQSADFAYGYNLMILTTLVFPLLVSGLTKENLWVTLCSIAASFTIYIGLFYTFDHSLNDFEASVILAIAWLSVPLSYYVWMSPWPQEKLQKEAF